MPVRPRSCHCSHCCTLVPTILARPAADGGVGTYLMRAKVRDVALSGHRSRLSVRWVGEGRYVYEIDGHRHVLTPGNFLLVSGGQRYNSGSEGEVESFTLSFDVSEAPELPVVTRRLDGRLGQLLHTLTKAGRREVDVDLDEVFYEVLDAMGAVRTTVRDEIDAIGSGRVATREELYRRLCRARDFLHDHAAMPLTVEEMAAEACLSPFHFMRTFKRAFGVSPHRYLLDLRLDRARALLGRYPLGVVAALSGFADLSAFSKAFRARYGVPPSRVAGAAN
jgi:AraC-like DNA-binding protein